MQCSQSQANFLFHFGGGALEERLDLFGRSEKAPQAVHPGRCLLPRAIFRSTSSRRPKVTVYFEQAAGLPNLLDFTPGDLVTAGLDIPVASLGSAISGSRICSHMRNESIQGHFPGEPHDAVYWNVRKSGDSFLKTALRPDLLGYYVHRGMPQTMRMEDVHKM